MKAPRHWLISKTNRNSSTAEAISFTSALKSIGFFLRLRIGNSFKNANTVFRHDLKFHLRVFHFSGGCRG